MQATKIKDLNERQALYKLSEPVTYTDFGSGVDRETEYVLVSKATSFGYRNEVLVFPAYDDGKPINMLEIGGDCDCPGGHKQALEEMGCEVVGA